MKQMIKMREYGKAKILKETLEQRLNHEMDQHQGKTREAFQKQMEMLQFKQDNELKQLHAKTEKTIIHKIKQKDQERNLLI